MGSEKETAEAVVHQWDNHDVYRDCFNEGPPSGVRIARDYLRQQAVIAELVAALQTAREFVVEIPAWDSSDEAEKRETLGQIDAALAAANTEEKTDGKG